MSTHNICIRKEIRKILCGYPLLSVAMGLPKLLQILGHYNSLSYLSQYLNMSIQLPGDVSKGYG